MASGGGNAVFGGGGNAVFGGGFTKHNSPFENNPPSPTGGAFSFGFPTSPFGTALPSFTQTNSSSTTQPFGTAPFSFQHISTPSPFGTSPFSQTNSSTTISPFGQTSSSLTSSPFAIPPSPFRQTNTSSTTSPFGTAPFSFPPNSNSLTTSPFGTSPFPTGQTGNSSSTKPFGTDPFPFAIPPSSPFGTTVSTPTTPASNVSVFSPVPWKSSVVQGIRQKAYEITAFHDQDGELYGMLSISAMPFYSNRSHEELRLEDYTLTGSVSFGFPTSFSGQSTTTSPFSTGQTCNVFTRSSFGTAPPPNPFSQTSTSSTTSPCGTAPFSFPPTSNSLTTSPFGTSPFSTRQTGNSSTTKPFETAPFSFQQTSYSLVTLPSGTAPFPFDIPPSSPFGTTVSTPTIPASNASVFPPFWNTVPWKSSVEGTRQKAYEETVVDDGDGNNIYTMLSISAMPDYKNKSHEELRLEDCSLTGKAGTSSTTSTTAPTIQPISQPVVTPFPKFDYPFSTSQTISTTVPNSTTGVLQNSTVPVTSIPATGYYKAPDILPMVPKLRSPEYYMEPSTEDLEEIELRRPGFCCKVKDFVIGRRNYGSIKFLGETDVRNLDVESIVQFGNREVVVYKDKKGKPPVGLGLNKAAEITLLNIKCIDESTGNRCIDGPSVEKYKELLKTKATEQGSEFISYDPVKGEWRFKVEHF